MFNKVLVVCVGNICRSPIGAALLKKYLPNVQVTSAGIAALTGRAADSNSIAVLSDANIDLSNHIAQQLTAELITEHDLILVMEKAQIGVVSKLLPAARGKIMLFTHWNGAQEISDPYRQSKEAFQFVYNVMLESAVKWSEKLNG